MPLTAFLSSYTQALIDAETPGKISNAEAASEFSRATALFFQNASILGAVPLTGSALLPSALAPLQSIMTSAFSTTDPASSSELMQAALLAYLNAGVSTWWPGTATGVALVNPLSPILTEALATPSSSQIDAKTKLANGICTWLTTSVLVNLTPSGTTNFS